MLILSAHLLNEWKDTRTGTMQEWVHCRVGVGVFAEMHIKWAAADDDIFRKCRSCFVAPPTPLSLSLPNWRRLFSSPGSIRHHHHQVPHVHPVGLQEQEQHVWRWWWLRPGKGRKILVLVHYYYYYRSESNPNRYNKFGILFYLNS